MKLASLMFLAVLTAGSLAHAADEMDLLSIKEVAVAQESSSGYYDVICTNGNRESVSASDIRYGDICPNSRSSQQTNMQSVQKRGGGLYDVVCRDNSKTIASSQQMFNNEVCNQPQSSIVIEDGVYSSPGRYDGVLKARYSGQSLVGVHVEFSANKSDMSCYDNICSGHFKEYSQTYYLKIVNRTSFEFWYGDRQSLAVFNKKN